MLTSADAGQRIAVCSELNALKSPFRHALGKLRKSPSKDTDLVKAETLTTGRDALAVHMVSPGQEAEATCA